MGWNVLLFGSKWVLIGLIYLILFILLLAVQREMAIRVNRGTREAPITLGSLRVLRSTNHTRMPIGSLFSLHPETHLGAEEKNEIVIDDPYISRYHARLFWDGVAWWVEDLESRNGTFVNKKRMPARQPQQLAPGAIIEMGDTALELQSE